MGNETKTVVQPTAAPATPDLVGAYLSGDMGALRSAVHDRTVAQVQGYVNTPNIIQGKTDILPAK